jgi:Xaa-Pro aminopeptidase
MTKIVSSQQNVRYLSGFTGSIGILLINGSKQTLIIDGRYTDQAKKEVYKGIKTVQAPLGSSLLKCALDIIKKSKPTKIGIEDDKVDALTYNKIKSAFQRTEVYSISNELREKRCVKEQDEITSIRKASLIADVVFDCIIRMVKPGITESDIGAEIDYLTKIMGGEAPAFETLVASGSNTIYPHCKPTKKEIKRGELVLMDFGVRFNSYNSDMTRMISIGVPTKKQHKLYNTILKAQESAIEQIRDGVPASNIDKAARDVLKKEKLDKYFTHATGHGIGLSVHEGPRVSQESKDILKEGMVVTVEPGFYIKGIGGFRVEDMVLVKKNGFEVLTRSPKNLVAI